MDDGHAGWIIQPRHELRNIKASLLTHRRACDLEAGLLRLREVWGQGFRAIGAVLGHGPRREELSAEVVVQAGEVIVLAGKLLDGLRGRVEVVNLMANGVECKDPVAGRIVIEE